MCGKGRAEPPLSEQQFGKLACQRAVLIVAIRRAKRAEENAEHLARLRQRVVQVGDSASEASRGKCGAFSEAASESCSGWRFGERSEPKKNAEHLARLRQSGQFQEKKDRKE